MNRNTRRCIIEMLSVPPPNDCFEMEKLDRCIKRKFGQNNLDFWLEGVIQSLYFKQNGKILVLAGPQGIGKSHFLRNLLPLELQYFASTSFGNISNVMYDNLILDVECDDKRCYQALRSLAYSSSARVMNPDDGGYYFVEKRLASFAVTTNYGQIFDSTHASLIKLDIESFDHKLFNSIDKLQLWREIFQLFKK